VSKPPPPSRSGAEAEIDETARFAPRFDAQGLIPVIVTAAGSGEVLMFAWMNEEALARTIETGEAHYWSRSRAKLWRKGEESGNGQRVVEMRVDCDQDAILMKVEMTGADAACHTGRRSCFYRAVPLGDDARAGVALRFVDAERRFDPASVYGHAGAAREP
jgi:phosphoribosyl-AMP cyclohydrolase